MESPNELYFIDYMPKVSEYKGKFDSLNGLLNKTTLTGKISSLEIAENLFIFMDETQQKFSSLQTNLIKTLLSENFKKVMVETSMVAEMGAIMFGKLFSEMDVLATLLSKDSYIQELFTKDNEDTKSKLNHYLANVGRLYKQVADIFLVDKNGYVLMQMNKESVVKHIKEQFVGKVINSDETQILKGSFDAKGNDYFSVVVGKKAYNSEGAVAGAILVCLKIDEEANIGFEALDYGAKGLSVALMDEKDYVVVSDEPYQFVQQTKVSLKGGGGHGGYGIIKQRNKDYIAAPSNLPKVTELNTKWKIALFIPLKNAFFYNPKRGEHDINVSLEEFTDASSLMTEELQNIMYEAENINEDLGDVVINGEIIASKSHSYSLNPILDNIRILSEEINKVCIESIEDLQNTILHSSVGSAKFLASLILDTIDRYFYFTAGKLAYISSLKEIEGTIKDKGELSNMTSKIKELDSLFAECENIVVADGEGRALACSKDGLERITKKGLDVNLQFKAKSAPIQMPFAISDLEKNELTNDKYGFTICTPIRNQTRTDGSVIGCSLVSMEAKKVFEDILLKALPRDEKGEVKKNTFALVTTKTKKVVATTEYQIEPNSILEIDEKFFKQHGSEGMAGVIDFKGAKYIVGSNKSKGYRGFNTRESHQIELFAFIFIKI